MKKYLLFTLTIILVSCTFLGCKAKKTEEKTYIFASDATWPPLEYIDNDGHLTGFEVELIPMIGDAVGKKFEVKNIPWDTIFAGLRNKAYDGIASGVSVTEERKLSMDFSTPILNAGQVVIVRAEDKDRYSSISFLEGKTVGVQIGTTGDLILDDYPLLKRKQYDDIGLAIMDMINGNISACICDSIIASDFVLANEDYKGKLVINGAPFTQEDIAIAVQKGNSELLVLINEGLAKLIENGKLDELKAKWNLI